MCLKKLKYSMVFLLYAFHVQAGNIDNGEIHFRGYVIDDAPVWTWHIASSDQFWDVDISDATESSENNLLFNMKNKGGLPFLEGYLKKVAERGGAEIVPEITFSSAGLPITPDEGGETTHQKFRASVPVMNADTGERSGLLHFTLEQALGMTFGHQGTFENQSRNGLSASSGRGMALVTGETVTQVKPQALSGGIISRLSSLLLLSDGFHRNGLNASFTGNTVGTEMLTNPAVSSIAASYASVLSDFELEFVRNNVPQRWRAGISVTVTVQ